MSSPGRLEKRTDSRPGRPACSFVYMTDKPIPRWALPLFAFVAGISAFNAVLITDQRWLWASLTLLWGSITVVIWQRRKPKV